MRSRKENVDKRNIPLEISVYNDLEIYTIKLMNEKKSRLSYSDAVKELLSKTK